MKNLLQGTRFLFAETAHERLPLPSAEVAFIGRSNVGKSSLLCAITNNWKLARVSKTPGATRAIHVYEAKEGRWLVDFPGYGYSVGPERQRNYWPEMIGRYIMERPSLNRIYVLIDAEVGPSDIDQELVHKMHEKRRPVRVVATKIDKISRNKYPLHLKNIAIKLNVSAEDIFWVSAKKGDNINLLQNNVIAELGLRESGS